MKNKLIILMLVCCLVFPMIKAEIVVNEVNSVDPLTSIISFQGQYSFLDTSADGSGGIFPDTMALDTTFNYNFPMNVKDENGVNYTIDSCKISASHIENNYTLSQSIFKWFYLKTDTVNVVYNSTNQPPSVDIQNFDLYNNDIVLFHVDCLITNYSNVNVMDEVGHYVKTTMLLDSQACNSCSGHTFEQAVNQSNSISIFDNIQSVVSWDWELWLIMDWVIKLGFLLIALLLVFYGGYYLYKFVENLERQI